jgi:hypothetical protein
VTLSATTARTACYVLAVAAATALAVLGVWSYSVLGDHPALHRAMSPAFLIGYACLLSLAAMVPMHLFSTANRTVREHTHLTALLVLTAVGVMGLLAGLSIGVVDGHAVSVLAGLFAAGVAGNHGIKALQARSEAPEGHLAVVPDVH